MKNLSGICMCGCGRQAPLSSTTRRGYKRGEPLMFIKGHHSRRSGPEYEIDDKGCWIWLGSITCWGYGNRGVPGARRTEGAHRFYYRQAFGEIPAGHDVHHRCGVPACVNPEHLVALSRRDHMREEGRKPFGNPKAWAA
jgi:hypothetical protein